LQGAAFASRSRAWAAGPRVVRRRLGLALLALALTVGLAGCSVQLLGAQPAGPAVTVPIQVVEDASGATLVLLSVTIHNQGPFTFALDTGASTSLLDRTVTQRLGLPPAGRPQPIIGVSGQETAVPVKVQSWDVSQLRLPSVTAASANVFATRGQQRLQGLLGSDVWRQYGSIAINYSAQTLTVPGQITS
jgi:hypothetical protein